MEEIINSVMQSPENTNPNVLRGQLQKIGGGSGGGVMVVNCHFEPVGKTGGMRMVCDKTADEMLQASETKSVVLKAALADNDVVVYMHIIYATFAGAGNGYMFLAYSINGSSANSIVFSAMTADDYPSYSAS